MMFFRKYRLNRKIEKLEAKAQEYRNLADLLTWKMTEALDKGLVEEALRKQRDFRCLADVIDLEIEKLRYTIYT